MSEAALKLLESIDGTMKQILRVLQAAQPKPVASANDLAGPYGDPKVYFRPKNWAGPDMKGRAYSECPQDFLEMYADLLDWMAAKDEAGNVMYKDKPSAPRKREDASKARAWAQRNAGRNLVASTPASDWAAPADDGFVDIAPDESEIPFTVALPLLTTLGLGALSLLS